MYENVKTFFLLQNIYFLPLLQDMPPLPNITIYKKCHACIIIQTLNLKMFLKCTMLKQMH
jgi:hypothetical protein